MLTLLIFLIALASSAWAANEPTCDQAPNHACMSQAETITANWVNTAYPWADNEVSDTLTCNNVIGFTAGSVPFAGAGGTLTQDNTNLFWDATNRTLRLIGKSDTVPEANLVQLKNGRLVLMNDPNSADTRAGHLMLQFDLTSPLDNTDMSFRKDAAIKVVGGGDQNRPAIIQLSQHNVSGNTFGVGEIYFGGSRGATPTTRTAVDNGDWLGVMRFFGDDGTDMNNTAAQIYVAVDETLQNVATDVIPGSIVLETLKQASIVSRTNDIERMRMTGNGLIGIGIANPDAPLDLMSIAPGGTIPGMVFRNPTETLNNGTILRFGFGTGDMDSSNNLIADIRAVLEAVDPNPVRGRLEFWVNQGDSLLKVGGWKDDELQIISTGTGNGTVLLPNDSIGDTEVDFATVTCADMTMTDCGNITSTGTVNLTGATTNLGAGAVDAITEIAAGLKDGVGECGSGLLCLGDHTHASLAANGSNCTAGSAPLGVDAAGAVESCTDFEEDLSNSAGLATALSDESGTGVVAFTTSPVFTTPNIGTATGSVSGNAGTATALAANGANCAATECAGGVTAGGVAEACLDPLTSAELNGVEDIETATDDGILVGNTTAFDTKVLTDCDDTTGKHLNYDTTTNAFSCGTSGDGAGTVTADISAASTSGLTVANGVDRLPGAAADVTVTMSTASIDNSIKLWDNDAPAGWENRYLSSDIPTSDTEVYIANTFSEFGTYVDPTEVNAMTFSGDMSIPANQCWFSTTGIVCEGATDAYEGLFSWSPTGQDQTIAFPNLSDSADTMCVLDHAQTLTNKTLTTPTIASFANATHNHSNAAGGGNVSLASESTATTAASGDNDTSVATTAFVQQEYDGLPYYGTANTAFTIDVCVGDQQSCVCTSSSVPFSCQYIVPMPCTLRNLYVEVDTAIVSGSWVATLLYMNQGSDTVSISSITCTINSGRSCVDTSHTQPITAGQKIALFFDATSVTSSKPAWSVICD